MIHKPKDRRMFSIWSQMRGRCRYAGHKQYKDYGGRGINVCERWMKYENFVADMGQRPSAEHSLDRIDNNRGYEPGNCRWATMLEQQRNKRSNRFITFRGETLCVTEWAARVGLQKETLFRRLWNGWSEERALTTPTKIEMRNGLCTRTA